MIKLTINGGQCHIDRISGNGIDIMSELCVIVKSVCTAFTEDEKERDKLCNNMVLMVSNALKYGEERNWGADLEDDEDDENADLEDDENADF